MHSRRSDWVGSVQSVWGEPTPSVGHRPLTVLTEHTCITQGSVPHISWQIRENHVQKLNISSKLLYIEKQSATAGNRTTALLLSGQASYHWTTLVTGIRCTILSLSYLVSFCTHSDWLHWYIAFWEDVFVYILGLFTLMQFDGTSVRAGHWHRPG